MAGFWVVCWGLAEGDWLSAESIISGLLLGIVSAAILSWKMIEPRLRRRGRPDPGSRR
jgi:hypothetical protein